MSHRHVRHQLILYLDGDLSEQDITRVRDHLDQCPHCRRYFESFASAWRQAPDRVAPPPFLWTRVEARIREPERPARLLADVIRHFALPARPAVMLLTLIAGVLIGAYLGNIPASTPDNREAQIAVQDSEDVFDATYLESFNDMPPESVGQAYMLVASEGR